MSMSESPKLSILIASNNVHKHQELREIFELWHVPHVRLLVPRALGLNLDPKESADTYAGNVLIKSRAFVAALNGQNPPHPNAHILVMADDSGLEVDALGGRPGVLSARYHKAAPNQDGCAELLREMQVVPDHARAARFQCYIALADLAGAENIFVGICAGRIGYEKRGSGGFGFDPVFELAESKRHMAELSPSEKHQLSHRGLALQQVIDFLWPRLNRLVRYQGAIVRGDEILLIRHRDHATDFSYWLLPGGGIERGETEEACVVREMREETNLDIHVERLLIDEPMPVVLTYHWRKTYLCRIVNGEPAPGYEPEEDAAAQYGIVEVRWFNLRDMGSWDGIIKEDTFTYPQLLHIRQVLGMG
jgi:XTP/dITP diphosphohydrolase